MAKPIKTYAVQDCTFCPFVQVNSWDIASCDAPFASDKHKEAHRWEAWASENDVVAPPDTCPLRQAAIRVNLARPRAKK